MKYIRTKDGRILNYEKLNEISKLSISMDAMEKNCDFKIGDTIEELCDEIVEIIDGKAQVVYADISFSDLAIAKIRGKNNAIIYGAIWTDKGLIYVAKMNDKGELELLWEYTTIERITKLQ